MVCVHTIYINTPSHGKQLKETFKGIHRIKSEGELHPLFGPPLIAKHVDDDNIIIAAHDVCVIGTLKEIENAFIVITTLPVRPHNLQTFNHFVKFRCPNAIIKRRRRGLKQCRKLNIDFSIDHGF